MSKGFASLVARHGVRMRRTSASREDNDVGQDAHGAYGTYVRNAPAREEKEPPRYEGPRAMRPPPLAPVVPPQAPVARDSNVHSIPDAWHLQFKVPPAPEVRESEPARRPGPKKKAPHKRRGISLNVAVSEEEAHIIKQFAANRGVNFSEWARGLMFTAMKCKAPPRD